MFTKNFNKIGDTSFRTKKQLFNYVAFFLWMVNKIKKNEDLTKKEFIKWAKTEKLYNYSNSKNSKFNRFDLVLKTLKNSEIISKNNQKGKYFDEALDFCQKGDFISFGLIILNNYKNKKNIQNINLYPIRDFMSFIKKNPNANNIKALFCLSIYDGTESFNSLYKNENLINKILKINFNLENIANKKQYFENEIIKLFKYKKLGFEKKKWIIKILNNWKEKINIEELQSCYKETKWKFLKFGIKRFEKNYSYEKYKKISKKNFIKKMLIEKYENLLKKEYLDLWLRWFFDLNLLSSSSKKKSFFCNINKLFIENNKWKILNFEKIYSYPFNKEKTKLLLEKMDENFIIPKEIDYPVSRATWAEYIVNLAFAYKYNIKPKDFNNFSNTIVSNDLLPLNHATGNKPDFSFLNQKEIHVIETTIHKTQNAIIDNEVTRICRHAINEYNKNTNCFKIKLSLISFLENKHFKLVKNISLSYFQSKNISKEIYFEYLSFKKLANTI